MLLCSAEDSKWSVPLCCSSRSTSWLEGSPVPRCPKPRSVSCVQWSPPRCCRWLVMCGRLPLSDCVCVKGPERTLWIQMWSKVLQLYVVVFLPNHLQLIEDGGLSSVVQTHNDDFVLWRKVENHSATTVQSGFVVVLIWTHCSLSRLHKDFFRHQSTLRTRFRTRTLNQSPPRFHGRLLEYLIHNTWNFISPLSPNTAIILVRRKPMSNKCVSAGTSKVQETRFTFWYLLTETL